VVDLRLAGGAVGREPAPDRVVDPEVGTVKICLSQLTVEELARRTHERFACMVLHFSWALAYQGDACP
jgi:hypothetical protein